jgi:two-component sensor histidine kinase
MPTLAELAYEHTELETDAVNHLGALVSEWGMLADFCFADMLLYLPIGGDSWLIAAQVRAATGQTLYHQDYVNTWASDSEKVLLTRCYSSGEISQGEIFVQAIGGPANMLTIPVRYDGKIIAVLSREWVTDNARRAGQLESTYAEIFGKLAEMVAQGLFPFEGRVADASVAPRVGDGAIVLDAQTRVRYASPNAVSALHRVGVSTNAIGQTLAELSVAESAARNAYERKEPVIEEIEQTAEVTLLTRSIPLLVARAGGTDVIGGVLLLRDVSELRRRDRLLLTKDATIREIHHRVKNNLQTVSALLRLQSRRIEDPAAGAALDEAVRRIASIALVHETLSNSTNTTVAFDEVLGSLVTHALELSPRMGELNIERVGEIGLLESRVATPLSLVVTELIHNALEHGLAESGTRLRIELQRYSNEGLVTISDDGIGLPQDFDLLTSSNLGLQIVRTLTENELQGELKLESTDKGTQAKLRFPL